MSETVAERVIQACGGVARCAELAQCSENWVYRWRLPRDRGGTGGDVPVKAQKALLRAAAEGAVDIRPEHFFAGAAE